ncbi:MAG: MT-A70 family methyltransferase [Shewanella sp.]
MTKYGVIYADPAWAFLTYSGKSRTPTQKKFRGEAEDHYDTMSLADMVALPVSEWAADDCVLFMWVVGSHLPDALALGAAWGFTYKTDGFVWIKQKLINADQIDLFSKDIAAPRMSMGYYTRKETEYCLIFTKGKPKRLSKSVRQVITEPRREHSRKPDIVYDRIEQFYAGPYLEMNARQKRAGWDQWGNETDKFEVAA